LAANGEDVCHKQPDMRGRKESKRQRSPGDERGQDQPKTKEDAQRTSGDVAPKKVAGTTARRD